MALQCKCCNSCRMVPMIDELGHNGILAGGLGAVAGAALVGGFVRWRESAAGDCLDVVKPQKMAGIVKDATTTCDGSVESRPARPYCTSE